MILALALAIASPLCELEDAACWRGEYLQQLERAERAEARNGLEVSARQVAEQMYSQEKVLADRWKETAIQVAPKQPMFFEHPAFLLAVGFVSGAVLTTAIVYGLTPAAKLVQ